jgi:hypothetical protein
MVLLARRLAASEREVRIDLSGLSVYPVAFDVDDAAWGTRDPTESAPSDVFVTMVVATADQEVSRGVHGFCLGGRGEDGCPPTITITRSSFYWPAGTMCTLTLSAAPIPIGLLGAGH